jgi:hypothetical protein
LKHDGESSTAVSLAWFTVHQFVGSYGIVFFTPYVVAAAFDVLRIIGKSHPNASMFWILTGTPYFPIQITLGSLLGWLIGRHFQHRVMMWIWVIPLARLLLEMISRFNVSNYFGWGCGPWNRCLDQVIYTLPFYVALSYSLGSLLARITPERFQRPNPRHFWVYSLAGLFFFAAFCSSFVQFVGFVRRGDRWTWFYLQPLIISAGASGFLILYSVVVAKLKPPAKSAVVNPG